MLNEHEPELVTAVGPGDDAADLESALPPVEDLPDSAIPNQPMWLHPSSLLFDLISHFRQLLIPAAIALFSAARGNQFWTFFAIAMFFPSLLHSAFQYFTLRYRVADGEMTIRKGLFFRRLRTIPVNRIQNIDLVQNPLHRMLGVAEVRVETASGSEAEARLRVLSMAQIAALRHEIFAEQQLTESSDGTVPAGVAAHPAASRESETDSPVAAVSQVTLLSIPSGWLVRAGLASNRGMLLIGVVLGLAWQFEQEWMFDIRQWRRFLPGLDGSFRNLLLFSVSVLGILVLLRLFGIVWYVLRFYGYSLVRHGEDLRVSCGLFTRVSATIPRKRIQFISVHRSLVGRWMGLASVRIETAGGGGGDANDASAMVSRRWFVPVIPDDRVEDLLYELRPGMVGDPDRLVWHPLARNARWRLVRRAMVQSLVIAAIGMAITRPWGFVAGICLAPLLVVWAFKKSRAMHYSRGVDQVAFRSGVLNRKTSFTFFDKIQTARLFQSPFDRRWGHAVLAIDTAAAGPAEHRIEIPWLDATFASNEYRRISRIAAAHRPDFG